MLLISSHKVQAEPITNLGLLMEVNFGLKSLLKIVFTPDKKDKAVHLLKISPGIVRPFCCYLHCRIPVACIGTSLDK